MAQSHTWTLDRIEVRRETGGFRRCQRCEEEELRDVTITESIRAYDVPLEEAREPWADDPEGWKA